MTTARTCAAALALAVALGTLSARDASAGRWDESYFPNLPVVSQDGETFDFYDDLIRDKIVVINFVYTSCTDICGLSTARMSYIRDELGALVGRDVFIYSISLDPKNDTPEKLAAYAEAFDRGPGWEFLTGKPQDIDTIRHKLGERSRSLNEHRSDMVMGNDRTGFWRRTSVMGNLAVAARQIRNLDPAVRAMPRPIALAESVPDARRYALDRSPGQALFLKACAACHSIGAGDRVGPDLHGVTWKRDRDWLMRAIMEPDRLRARKDREMIALDARYPGVVMPDLDLSIDDTRDVLLYIATRSVAVNEARGEAHAHAGDGHDHAAGHADHTTAHETGHGQGNPVQTTTE